MIWDEAIPIFWQVLINGNERLNELVIRMVENTQWKWCYRSILSAAIFAAICLLAFNFIDGMSGGFALAFVSFFLAVSGVAVAALFFHRARAMDFILNGTRLLAHWIYSSEVAEQSARREYAEHLERNRAMFFVVGGMIVIASLIMITFAGDGGLITGAFLLAFTVLLSIISRVAPGLVLRNSLRAPKEAYIAENGIIYEGTVYPFSSFMMKMEGAKFKRGSKGMPALLVFSFTQAVGLNISSSFDIEIPVPDGQEEVAGRIADMLGGRVN
jgi:hypothetical protein